ncbi:response regulator [Anaerosinus massiliensis]|uniref:response regulator n=1 Tax=Massilibacillus massiliensis TaxID=1806837 RepID=UPI000A77728F|nr:response regulator [Massilibacillus massiliensis]
MKILIADDEATIREIVALYLEKEGFTVLTAKDGDEALDLECEERPDLLLLDIMLPKISGLELCQTIQRNVPKIFLTAKSAENDKIIGFSLGADDYITKPFSPRELVARVKAVLKRSGALPIMDLTTDIKGMIINHTDKAITIQDQIISLSPKEFELLNFFIRNPKHTFSREQLLTNVWGYDYDGDARTVDATVKRLRQKLNLSEFHYIHTARGFGYRFEVVKK